MRSYALAIAASMLLAALYVFQNVDDVTVRFFVLEHVFPQGVWEVLLFSVGAVVMWFFSLFATLEIRSKYRSQLKDRDKRIAALEEEKNSLLAAIGRVNAQPEYAVAEKTYAVPANEPQPPLSSEREPAATTGEGETERMSG